MLNLFALLLCIYPLLIYGNCNLSSINIKPNYVVLNSTSQTKFICTKNTNDNQDFEINSFPNISSESLQLSTNQLNKNSIEIILQSFDYIGKFRLLCSLKGRKNCDAYSNITIGKAPGFVARAEPCIVYYDEYIDCIVRAPTMVKAINDRLDHNFSFIERRFPSQPKHYRSIPDFKPIKVDSIKGTLTFRWFPSRPRYFPSDYRNIIYATITNFGTTNHTMDMTPVYRISSNFMVRVISSNDLQIEFNHGNFSSITFCQGNLTPDNFISYSNEKKTTITFDESNLTIRRATKLLCNTWYIICFQCYRDVPSGSISDTVCHRYKTSKSIIQCNRNTILIIICCCVSLCIIIMLIRVFLYQNIKEWLSNCRGNRRPSDKGMTDESIELDACIPQNLESRYLEYNFSVIESNCQ